MRLGVKSESFGEKIQQKLDKFEQKINKAFLVSKALLIDELFLTTTLPLSSLFYP